MLERHFTPEALENRRLDLDSMMSTDPPPADDVFLGLEAGKVASLVATGGTGKSWFALQAGMAVASPEADVLRIGPGGRGRVLYVSGEDDADTIHRRVRAIADRLSPEARREVAKNMDVYPVVGEKVDLGGYPGCPEFTDEVMNLGDTFMGYRLIILDPLRKFHSLDENSNGQMSVLLDALERVATRTGAAVLFCHHVNKLAVRDGDGSSQAVSRGASALVDNVRWSATMAKMTADEAKGFGVSQDRRGFYLGFRVVKQNYGPPATERWFERKEGGVLTPTSLAIMQLESKPGKEKIYNGKLIKFTAPV